MSDRGYRGWHDTFIVRRKDHRDLPGADREDARYFVLDLTYDRASRIALAAYAEAVASEYPRLASDLRAELASLRLLRDASPGA